GRMDARGARLEHAPDVRLGSRSARDLGGVESLEGMASRILDRLHRLLPGLELGRARRGPEPSVVPVPRIDGMLSAESSDLLDRLGRGVREAERLLPAAD